MSVIGIAELQVVASLVYVPSLLRHNIKILGTIFGITVGWCKTSDCGIFDKKVETIMSMTRCWRIFSSSVVVHLAFVSFPSQHIPRLYLASNRNGCRCHVLDNENLLRRGADNERNRSVRIIPK